MHHLNRTIQRIAARELAAAKGKSNDDPCWDGYVAVGMKEKDGRMVPNCVPEDEDDEDTETAAGDSHKPPRAVANAAKRGLQLRAKFKRGGTNVGVARARDLSSGRGVSAQTIKRMCSYFARHAVDKQGKDWNNTSNPSAGYIAWLLWGGEPGRAWATKINNKDA